jgi:hypothetical protein
MWTLCHSWSWQLVGWQEAQLGQQAAPCRKQRLLLLLQGLWRVRRPQLLLQMVLLEVLLLQAVQLLPLLPPTVLLLLLAAVLLLLLLLSAALCKRQQQRCNRQALATLLCLPLLMAPASAKHLLVLHLQ